MPKRPCLLLIACLLLSAIALTSVSNAKDEFITQNRFVRASWSAESGLALSDRESGRTFVSGAKLSASARESQLARVHHKTFGRGNAIVIGFGNGESASIETYDRLPFVLIQPRSTNPGTQTRLIREVLAFSGNVNLQQPVRALKSFGTGGLLSPQKNPGSYAWMTIVHPESRNGVVFGWLTHDRGSGVLFSRTENQSVTVDATIEYGQLRLPPGEEEPLEVLAIGFFVDARLGLEAWADAVASVYNIHLPPQPTGYCTWYSKPHGGASDEVHLAELATFARKELVPYGFSVVQIDDKWQDGLSTNGPNRNFTTHRPGGPYPGGMKAAADQVRSNGLIPGIWFMPFAGTYYDPFFANHQDWFVKRTDGQPYETDWGGTCLDMTHPGAREHLRSVAHRITHEWGYGYLKLDGLWTGTATKQQYVNSGYRNDQMGDAVFHDSSKTHIQAYRDGLRLVREVAGPTVFILGCNGPQNMRSYGGAFGLLDGMRIGPDNGSDWSSLTRGPLFGTRHYFLHGRIWHNDPDPVYVRDSMPLDHARLICSWVALSGQMNLSSDWLPGLPPERLDILKRTMPPHRLRPRPVDLFDRDLPSMWILTDTTNGRRRDVLGLFNWTESEQSFPCNFEKIGLKPATTYAAYDFWANKPVGPLENNTTLVVPPRSCRIIALRPVSSTPQLISTSRHVTQGILDVTEEKESRRFLAGRSRVIAGDPYELRILSRRALQHVTVSETDAVGGVTTSYRQTDGLLRVIIRSPADREVSWNVSFR